MKKEKLILVSEEADESIKSSSSTIFDMSIFKSFTDLEMHVDALPIVLNTLIVTSKELPFNNRSVERLRKLLNSSFFTVTGSFIYLIDNTYDREVVEKVFNSWKFCTIAVYQGDLSLEYISGIISGDNRTSSEGQVGIVTYRIRASEYVKYNANRKLENSDEFIDEDDGDYLTDEDELNGIPAEEEPEELLVSTSDKGRISYYCGVECKERTILSFLAAQYYSLSGKTVIMERDVEYHTLTEFVTKTNLKCEMISISDIYKDVSDVIKRVKATNERLIVFYTINKISYDYDILFEVLYNNLYSRVQHFIKECDLTEVPYGSKYTLVSGNNVPDLLKMCQNLKYEVDPTLVRFACVQLSNLFPAVLTEEEIQSVLGTLLRINCIVKLYKVNGLILKKGVGVYDLSGIAD